MRDVTIIPVVNSEFTHGPGVFETSVNFNYSDSVDRSSGAEYQSPGFSDYSKEDQQARREIAYRHALEFGSQPDEKYLENWSTIAAMTMNCADLILAFLILLQSRNNVTISEVDIKKQNKARKRRNKPPLYSYHTVDLSLTEKQEQRLKAAGFTHEECRAHLVRGHFKVRKTGVFWWMPHIRGNKQLGWVEKDYKVFP